MATTRLTSRAPSDGDPSSSQSSSGDLSGGKIAAIVIGTALAIGLVCLLLSYPQFLLARAMKTRSRHHPPGSEMVRLKDLPPRSPGRASGNDGSGSGADDAGRRRRQEQPGITHVRRTQSHGNHITLSRQSGSPVIINNNIYINSDDYLHPLPALNPGRNQDPAPPPPAIEIPRNAQRASRLSNIHCASPPNGGIPPQRTRPRERPAPPTSAPTPEPSQASGFWNVADWARGVAPRPAPCAPVRGRTDSPFRARGWPSTRRAVGSYMRERVAGSYTRERTPNVPGAFPADDEVVERFRLVTAPARALAPAAPSHGDDGFWVREGRESRWRRLERDDRRDRQERDDRRERGEREERRERDRLEREDRRERVEREERRERREREDRRERW